MIVTSDGPAGAGKRTAARGLAARLGFRFLDTGAMYRAIAWACLQRQVDMHDPHAVADVAHNVRLRLQDQHVYVDEHDVTQSIRSLEVTQETRHVAGNLEVRKHLVQLQREMAAGDDVVAEGRDQGTVAFPFAECKFFLTASAEHRAKRRQLELAARSEQVPLEEILHQLSQRDERDQLREIGALKPAVDAIHVDTSGLAPQQVVDLLERLVRERMA